MTGTIDINPDIGDLFGGWGFNDSVTTIIPVINLDRVPPPPPVEEPIAHIRWGKQSAIGFTKEGEDSGITIINNGGDDIPPVHGTLDFFEESRVEEEVAVHNPDDVHQYVIDARITQLVVRPPSELLQALNQPIDQLWRFIIVNPDPA